jgi:tetratricopeptide (TPR) repeat protein
LEYSKLVENLQKAVEIYPGFAEAWQFLGETYIMEGKESEAMDAFRRAIEADHQYLPPYATLGELELRANHIEEAAQLTGRAIELNPYAIGSQYCHAIAQYYLGDLGKAEESLRKVLESSEAGLYPASHRLLGAIYSERKDYGSAAEEFNRFLETNPPENDAEEVRKISSSSDLADSANGIVLAQPIASPAFPTINAVTSNIRRAAWKGGQSCITASDH